MSDRDTVTLPRKAVEDAVYAIGAWSRGCDYEDYFRDCADVLDALRACLETGKAPQPQGVGTMLERE